MLYFLEKRLENPEVDFNQLDVKEAQNLIKEYRIKVMEKLIEMDKSYNSIRDKEYKEYLECYKEEGEIVAYRKRREDLENVSYIERWKQVLNGQSLSPSSLSDKKIEII